MTSQRPHPTPLRRLAALALIPVLAAGCGGDANETASAEAQVPPGAQEPQLVDLAGLGFDEGNEETAALGVVEFSDFGCVFCAGFHDESYPVLYDEFVDAGDVLWKYIPVTIAGFPNGEMAGLSGICAAELGDFGTMRDFLFERREEWMSSPGGEALFVGYAQQVGLDSDGFRSCLNGPDARATLERNNEMATRIGVTGTPTFIVAGVPVRGAPPLEPFQETLRELVNQSRAMGSGPR